MKHNAHYPTEFDGVYLPAVVHLIDTRADEVIATYEKGSDFGDLLRKLFSTLPSGATTIEVGSAKAVVFRNICNRRERKQIATSVRDFIVHSLEVKAA